MSPGVAVVLALALTASGLASRKESYPLEGRPGSPATHGAAGQMAASPPPARVLVMPFDNVKREGRIFWLGEASAVLLADDLNALGVDAITREERRQAFERLQVPSAATLTDATIIRIGQLVGAASVIVGSLQLDGDTLVAHARSIALDTGRVQTNVTEGGPVAELFTTFERIARKIAPPSGKTPADIERLYPPVAAFEDFVKGLLAATPATSIGYLNAALKLYPGYDRVRLALWDVYTDQSDHQLALAAVQPVAADSPWARRARFRAGLSQIALKKYDEAFTTFRALMDAQPTAAVLNNLGVIQSRRGGSAQTGRPADFFKKAADTDPGDPDYFFNLGYAHWSDRDAQAAIYWLREAVRRNAADGEAHYVLGTALALAGNGGEAAREKDLARRLSSTFEQWDKRPSADAVPKGLERLKTDIDLPHASRLDQTLAATERRDQRDLAQFYLDRGRRLVQQENDRDAIIELNRALYLSPYQPQAHLLLGRIHLRNGRVRDAIDALKISLWSEETVEAHVMLAEAYLRAKDAAAARAEAQRALALDPASAEAKRLLEKAGPGSSCARWRDKINLVWLPTQKTTGFTRFS
jgi:tetratricopeptide (TPR) repeat protein